MTAPNPAMVERFWSRFYARSMELFGDKQTGTLKEMTDKAMERLKLECLAYAINPDGWDTMPEKSGRFNHAGFAAHCDQVARANWRMGLGRDPGRVVLHYLALIHDCHIDRKTAVELIVASFGFPSYGAAYQWLKNHHARPLPPNWG